MNTTSTINSLKELSIHDSLFTEEEIDARLQSSEEDFAAGRCYTNDQVLSDLRSFIDSL